MILKKEWCDIQAKLLEFEAIYRKSLVREEEEKL